MAWDMFNWYSAVGRNEGLLCSVMQPVGSCLVCSLCYSVVKYIIIGKAQRQLAYGYVYWASDGFSHCISCGGNAVLSKVTHLHLLFLRQPKGSMKSWEKGLEICFRCQDWFFVAFFGSDFWFSLWNSVYECGWYHIRVQKCTNWVFSFLSRQSIYNAS